VEILQAVKTGLVWFGLGLVLLTALLPALMATLNAILFHSMAEQLAQRHGAMIETFNVLKSRLDEIAERSRAGRWRESLSRDVLELAEQTEATLAAEVAEWASFYLQPIKET